jgi:hypothetical protein
VDGATLDVGVVVVDGVVLLLLGPLLPPPHPTASTSMAAPPKVATVTLAPCLIAHPTSRSQSMSSYPASGPRKLRCDDVSTEKADGPSLRGTGHHIGGAVRRSGLSSSRRKCSR